MNIELTEEQAEAYKRGESITLDPPKQWEPKGGNYYIVNGEVFRGSNDTEAREFGNTYISRQQAEVAATAMRTHNRLLAYIAEFDKGWVADWNNNSQNKHYITSWHYNEDKTYRWRFSTIERSPDIVYMSRNCAKGLVEKLNNGEIKL